jgi:hypothetical protein
MIEPLEPWDNLQCYIQLGKGAGGTITLFAPETIPPAWPGYFLRKEDAQYDQMLKALKNIRTHIYEIKVPI